MDSPYIASLLSPRATDISMFGAKAGNLAKAAQLGFAVPNGLVISRVCTENEFDLIAQKIIYELTLPVAVRSSAINEDSMTEAFAGQFETCLGVRSTVDIVNAFTIVKNSGSTDIFKINHGYAVSPKHIAVLVQSMVNATRAGIAFTRDPNTGESKVIIESNYGLGKSVVDGEVTPDSIEYLNDGTYKIYVGRKSMQVTLIESGIYKYATPIADTQRSSLFDDEIKEIANLAQKVELCLGFAADIEWAFDANRTLWLLQARPITTV